jgi:hypothetical protein
MSRLLQLGLLIAVLGLDVERPTAAEVVDDSSLD